MIQKKKYMIYINTLMILGSCNKPFHETRMYHENDSQQSRTTML